MEQDLKRVSQLFEKVKAEISLSAYTHTHTHYCTIVKCFAVKCCLVGLQSWVNCLCNTRVIRKIEMNKGGVVQVLSFGEDLGEVI